MKPRQHWVTIDRTHDTWKQENHLISKNRTMEQQKIHHAAAKAMHAGEAEKTLQAGKN